LLLIKKNETQLLQLARRVNIRIVANYILFFFSLLIVAYGITVVLVSFQLIVVLLCL